MPFRIADGYPFTELYRLTEWGQYVCEKGRYCEIVKTINGTLENNSEFVFPDDGGFGGVKSENGSWNGVMGLLQQARADFGVRMGYSGERSESVDLSHPLAFDSVAFATKKNTVTSGAFHILNTFQSSAWVAIVLSVFSWILVFSALMLRHQKSKYNMSTFLRNIPISAEILFGMRSFSAIRRNSLPNELFCGTAMICMRVLGHCFVAVFFMFLIAPLTAPSIRTFEELGKAAKAGKIKVAFDPSYHVGIRIRDAKSGTLKDIAHNALKYMPEKEEFDIMALLREGYVVIDQLNEIKWAVHSARAEKEIFISEDYLEIQQGGISFRKGFKRRYKEGINIILLRFTESGIYEKLLSADMENQNSLAEPLPGESTLPKAMLWDQLVGVFSILGVGYFISLLVLLCEIYLGRGMHLKKHEKRAARVRCLKKIKRKRIRVRRSKKIKRKTGPGQHLKKFKRTPCIKRLAKLKKMVRFQSRSTVIQM